MIREAEVAYASLLALLHEPVEYAVVHIAAVECGKRVFAFTDGVQQQIVDIVGLKLLQ